MCQTIPFLFDRKIIQQDLVIFEMEIGQSLRSLHEDLFYREGVER